MGSGGMMGADGARGSGPATTPPGVGGDGGAMSGVMGGGMGMGSIMWMMLTMGLTWLVMLGLDALFVYLVVTAVRGRRRSHTALAG